jgi:hypothetical protein
MGSTLSKLHEFAHSFAGEGFLLFLGLLGLACLTGRMEGIVVIIPYLCHQVIDDVLKSLAETLAVSNQEFGFLIHRIVQIGEDAAAASFIGVNFPKDSSSVYASS